MARRKTRKVRRSYSSKKASFRRRASPPTTKLIQPDAMVYGAVRGKISNMLIPITSKVPMGNYADEVGMGLLCWFVAKKTSGMLKNVATKGLVIENAMIGAQLATTGLSGVIGTGATTTGNSF